MKRQPSPLHPPHPIRLHPPPPTLLIHPDPNLLVHPVLVLVKPPPGRIQRRWSPRLGQSQRVLKGRMRERRRIILIRMLLMDIETWHTLNSGIHIFKQIFRLCSFFFNLIPNDVHVSGWQHTL